MRTIERTRGWLVAGSLIALGAADVGAQEPRAERIVTLPAQDRPLAVEASEVYRAGGLDAPDWAEFGRIRDVAFGPDGTLYILDQQAGQVLAVDRSGGYAGPVGGPGEGPGEYRLPTALATGPDGTIVIRDTGGSSYALFDAAGTYLDNVRPDGSLGSVSTVALGPGGWLVGVPNLLLRGTRGGDRLEAQYLVEGGGTVDDVTHLPLVRVHVEDGNPLVLDRLWIAPRSSMDGSAQVAYWPERHWALFPDGAVAVVDSTTWAVRVRASHVGGTDLRLTRPIAPRTMADRVRDAELRRRAENPGRTGGSAVAFGGTREERNEALARARQRMLEATVQFWPEIQVIQDMRADPEGRLWIQRASEGSDDPAVGGPIDVIDRDGAYLGTVEGMVLPDAFGPDGLAVWVEEGEMEVPIVVVRRITVGG